MFFQPPITPLPSGIDLNGKTAVVTGASSGIGLETARQLLSLKCSTIVLAVRNTSKGESCANQLRQDPTIKAKNPKAIIKILKMDAEVYASIQSFARDLMREIPIVDYLILNAGLARISHERSASGHELSLQVNYLSNALLLTELLPHLNASAERKGSPVRVTWVGSRKHQLDTSFEKKAPICADESVFDRFDNEKIFLPWQSYGDSKLLCAVFMYELAPRLKKERIVLNMICPGMIRTGIAESLPFPLRVAARIMLAIRSRPIQTGGILIVNAAVVAGEESHGRHLGDKEILNISQYIQSSAGHVVQKKVWEETMAELKKVTTLPVEFR